MSITSAIVARYDDSGDAEVVALRALLGTDKLWVFPAPDSTAVPYATIQHLPGGILSETKGLLTWVEDATIQVDVWAADKDSAESVMDAIEDAYVGKPLSISNRTHMGTHFDTRSVEPADVNLWRGLMQLRVLLQK